jgi:hypothetical protein
MTGFYNRDGVCLLRGTDWIFNIQQFYVLPTQCVYVFCVDLRTNRLFPYTALTDWFYNRDGVRLLRGTNWVFKCFVHTYMRGDCEVSTLFMQL